MVKFYRGVIDASTPSHHAVAETFRRTGDPAGQIRMGEGSDNLGLAGIADAAGGNSARHGSPANRLL